MQTDTRHSRPALSSEPNQSYPKIHSDPDMAASQITQHTNTHLNTHARTQPKLPQPGSTKAQLTLRTVMPKYKLIKLLWILDLIPAQSQLAY